MSILFNIEGPKGSGKSTLIRRMIDRKIATRSRGFSGDWNNLMTDDQVELDKDSAFSYIHDRGYLSHFIYAFLMSAEPDFNRVRCNGPKVEIFTWRAANIKMISDYLDALEHQMIILYTDHPQILIERIKNRKIEENKGATEDEWKVLEQSNQMFSLMAQFLKANFPDKVLAYRIESFTDSDELIDQIINDTNSNEVK